MIRNEKEYQEAVSRLQDEQERLAKHRTHLEEMGLGALLADRDPDVLRSLRA